MTSQWTVLSSVCPVEHALDGCAAWDVVSRHRTERRALERIASAIRERWAADRVSIAVRGPDGHTLLVIGVAREDEAYGRALWRRIAWRAIPTARTEEEEVARG